MQLWIERNQKNIEIAERLSNFKSLAATSDSPRLSLTLVPFDLCLRASSFPFDRVCRREVLQVPSVPSRMQKRKRKRKRKRNQGMKHWYRCADSPRTSPLLIPGADGAVHAVWEEPTVV